MTENTLITSRSNALVKKIKKLGLRKYREEFCEYVTEGKRWVADALNRYPQLVSAVICARSQEFARADYVFSDELFAEISETENNQGILAIMKIPEPRSVFESRCCLFLDRIRDPGNMGTIVRTACAAGYGDIVLRDCVDIYSPKVIRSSMTGILSVNIHYASDLECVTNAGYKTIAAVLGGENVFTAKLPKEKICLVVGNEADGIDDGIIESCDYRVTIPMTEKMESLNAAVSAGILMYELKY